MITVKKFYADWCGPCKMLSPIIESLKSQIPSVTFIDVDADTNQEEAAKYGIRGIPMVIIEKDGQVVERINGVNPEGVYLQKIQSHM